MVPSLMVMSVVLLYPLGSAVYFSFLRYYLGGGPTQFIGLTNYSELLADPRFWGDLFNTFVVVGFSVALQLVLGMTLALALYAATRGVRLISLLNFLPNVVTPVVGAIFLKWLFIGRFGLLEAAQIDGANGWQRLRYVILPMMKPLILFVVAIRAMDAFRFFDLVYVLTNGGPGTATETITLFTYQLAFHMLEVGKASALGVITLIIVAAMIVAMIWFMSRRGREAF